MKYIRNTLKRLSNNCYNQRPICYNPNTFAGLVGKVRKKLSRSRKEGRVEKKNALSAPAGPGARTRDLPSAARRGSPAARQGGCLDKQAFPCL